ncbi:DUF4270 family protein [Polaribacter sargassicola]|uniref:DUF4270 family protein n=1 Tax=Polaribacter sargassicola TaxID=2836891 RepID=UPI001F3730DB|nr:DUF4270 family protein [Polaribacter sp. DS7-9]MCG1035499.1 DUF4270 family protein [Polaribacter sp. DS7-9]
MRYFIIGVISIIFMAACATDDTTYEVGNDFVESEIQVRVIDTFSIKTGTFKLDSIITSSTNRILLGNVVNDKIGTLTASSFLQVSSNSFSIDNEAVYDSIVMVLNYDSYYFGDTLKQQTYKVHRVLETVEPEEGTSFYNTSVLSYDDEPLGAVSFTPRPNRETDSVSIRINDALGKEIFDKIVDNDINNSDDFLQFFKGLAIIPDTTEGNHILGFNVSTTESASGNSNLRLYYTVKDDDDDENNDYYKDFVIVTDAKQFNKINLDSSTSLLGNFEDQEEIKLSESTEDLIFTQAGSAVCARIEIPAIKKLLEFAENGTTLSAELTFAPLKGSYDDDNPLPETMSVFVVDHKNRIIKQLTDVDGVVSSAILNKDDDDDELQQNTFYTIDVSGFVEEILFTEVNLNYALMIQYDDYTSTANNLIINNDLSSDDRVKLSVKYLNY